MSGVTLSDLSKYHQGAMKWFKDGLVSEHNRLFAQTEDAGAVSFWPLGGTPLEGKVKFSFKETPPASGDKGPENPSSIAGVSSVGVGQLGKNLFTWTLPSSITKWGVTWSYDADGTITLNGTCNRADGTVNSSQYSQAITPPIYFGFANVHLKATIKHISGSYTLPSGVDLVTQFQFSMLNANGTYNYLWVNDNGVDAEKTFGIGSTSKLNCATLKSCGGVTYNNYKIKIQYEIISDYATSDYEAPVINRKTINLGNTYYGGSIDLATGLMTVTWGCVVLDGTETWSKHSDSTSEISHFFTSAGMSSGVMSNATANRSCSHFPFNSNAVANTFYTWGTATRIGIKLPATSYPDVSSLTSWLASEYSAGHPVTVAYELATPFTVQLTPLQLTALTQKDKYTPRMNTVYTDADSIQIRYRKSLIHDEDEKVQAIVALGGNV